MIGIYRIYHKKSGMSYIGQSIDIKKRIQDHFKNDYRSYIYNSIHKYGVDMFNWEVLEICDISELDCRECHWIESLDTIRPNGYNLKSGGANGRHSESSKQKMSEAHKGKNNYWYGRKLSDEHKEKLSKAQRGRKHHLYGKKRPLKFRQRISESNHNRVYSEETKRKISESQYKRWKKIKIKETGIEQLSLFKDDEV